MPNPALLELTFSAQTLTLYLKPDSGVYSSVLKQFELNLCYSVPVGIQLQYTQNRLYICMYKPGLKKECPLSLNLQCFVVVYFGLEHFIE